MKLQQFLVLQQLFALVDFICLVFIVTLFLQVSSVKTTPSSYRLLAARYVQRPQTKFTDKIDNSDAPFIPKLTYKPNAMIPLSGTATHRCHLTTGIGHVSLTFLSLASESLLVKRTDDGDAQAVPNPYKYEIEHFEYVSSQLDPVLHPEVSVKI